MNPAEVHMQIMQYENGHYIYSLDLFMICMVAVANFTSMECVWASLYVWIERWTSPLLIRIRIRTVSLTALEIWCFLAAANWGSRHWVRRDASIVVIELTGFVVYALWYRMRSIFCIILLMINRAMIVLNEFWARVQYIRRTIEFLPYTSNYE